MLDPVPDDSFPTRGFDVSSFDGLYRDGMKTSRDTSQSRSGVERIEALSGPASVLYCQAPPGGLVNMVTKRRSPRRIMRRLEHGASTACKAASTSAAVRRNSSTA